MSAPFAVRGLIEGFYGNPYTHRQRLGLIDFLARHGFNTFVYGPKDDPLLRARWREPYAGEDLARLGETIAHAQARGMRFVYAISPGLSIRYADAADLETLLAKLDGVRALGADGFALLLDDIPPVLQHAGDLAAFPDLASAHAAVAGAVRRHLGPDTWLIVCPHTYWGRGTEPYLATLAAGLDADVDLFWTGRAICSPTLDADDAEVFARTTGRPPLYWDNYPVNDVAMGWELHIGPYLGRDPRLATASRGIVVNPMELLEASLIPLATIGAFLGDPEDYDPEAAYASAIREVTGDDLDAEAFAVFADNVRGSCLNQDDAPQVTATLSDALFRLDRGDGPDAVRELAALATRLDAAAGHLLREPVANQALVEECRPWIEAFGAGADAIAAIARLAAAGRLESDAPAVLLPYLVDLRSRRVRVFGDALDMTLSDLTNTHTRPGRLTEQPPGGGART